MQEFTNYLLTHLPANNAAPHPRTKLGASGGRRRWLVQQVTVGHDMAVCLLIAATLLTSTSIAAAADEGRVPPALTADQNAAMNSVTQSSILSTVSFLAADELAGRDTPSPELRIASAYVAARFRGAGLEAIGDDDTFYHADRVSLTQTPEMPPIVTATSDGRRVNAVTLYGGPEDQDFEATVTAPSAETPAGPNSASIVMMIEPQLPPNAVSQPAKILAAIGRSVLNIAARGATVVLLKCDLQSPLWETAESLQGRPWRLAEALQPTCCVLLVSDSADFVGQRIRVQCEAQQSQHAAVRNVVGLLRGSDQDAQHEAIIVSAHLDHIGRLNRGPDTINNGADDNASGVTAVLALADAFGRLADRPERSIIFTTFWGEEQGLRGSKAFLARSPWPLQDIVANVNLEMVGRPEKDAIGKIWMTGWKHSNLGDLMQSGAQRIGVEIFDRQDVGEMLYTRSDNHSFVRAGIVGHSFSAGSLHSDYHQPSDEWQKLNIAHMQKVIQGLFAGTLLITRSGVRVTSR